MLEEFNMKGIKTIKYRVVGQRIEEQTTWQKLKRAIKAFIEVMQEKNKKVVVDVEEIK